MPQHGKVVANVRLLLLLNVANRMYY